MIKAGSYLIFSFSLQKKCYISEFSLISYFDKRKIKTLWEYVQTQVHSRLSISFLHDLNRRFCDFKESSVWESSLLWWESFSFQCSNVTTFLHSDRLHNIVTSVFVKKNLLLFFDLVFTQHRLWNLIKSRLQEMETQSEYIVSFYLFMKQVGKDKCYCGNPR